MSANKHLQILLLFTNKAEVKQKMNQVLQYIKSSQVTFIYIALYTDCVKAALQSQTGK